MKKLDLAGWPEILQIEDLSKLIGKAETTIRTCATCTRYAHLIPRPFKLPSSRRLMWYKIDVLDWMEQATTVQPGKTVRRGASTKSERVAADRAGMSVKEWRAQRGVGV